MNDTILLQDMINKYLKNNGKKTITELLEAKGMREEEGVITSAHKIVLQQMIYQLLKAQGQNINSEVEYGHQVLGVLSNAEKKYIDVLIQKYQEHLEQESMKVL